MRIDDTVLQQDTVMDGICTSTSDPPLEKSGVRDLDCGKNCLNGIKWPPEHHTKNTSGRNREFNVNGLRIHSPMITHGGRTLKKPARFVESDSDDASSRRKFNSAKRRKRPLSESSRHKRTALCENSRTKSLDGDSRNVLKNHETKGDLLSQKIQNGIRTDMEYEVDLAPTSGVVLSLSTSSNNSFIQQTESLCLKKAFNDFPIDLKISNSNETPPIKRGRGRPPKKIWRSILQLTSARHMVIVLLVPRKQLSRHLQVQNLERKENCRKEFAIFKQTVSRPVAKIANRRH